MEHFNVKTKNNITSYFFHSRRRDKKPNSEKMTVVSNTEGLQPSFSCVSVFSLGGNGTV